MNGHPATRLRRAGFSFLAIGLLCIALLAQAGPVRAAEFDAATRIKAAFLYHFCNYIDWPDSAFSAPDSPLVIGVIGSDVMADELRSVVSNRIAHDRHIEVRQLRAGESLDGLHLLFIGKTAAAPWLMTSANDRSLLVVTEDPDGLDTGSAINFIIEDDKVRFDIALPEISQRSLDVSARLLTVARVIHEEER